MKIQLMFKIVFLSMAASLLSGCVTNAIPTAENILINLSNSFPSFWRLATAFSYVMGFAMIVRALHHLKTYGESRTMMSSHNSLKTPLTLIFVGSAMIFSPTIYQTLLMTAFGTSQTTPLSYATGPSGLSPQAIQAFYGLIQVCGVFAFIRGWFILSRGGEQSSQPGTFGRGLTHILGGLLAINVVGTKDIVFSTIGLN